MNVATFIKWLEKQPQHLEVSVVQSFGGIDQFFYDEHGNCTETKEVEAVCFDDPHMQSRQTAMSLILGVE